MVENEDKRSLSGSMYFLECNMKMENRDGIFSYAKMKLKTSYSHAVHDRKNKRLVFLNCVLELQTKG